RVRSDRQGTLLVQRSTGDGFEAERLGSRYFQIVAQLPAGLARPLPRRTAEALASSMSELNFEIHAREAKLDDYEKLQKHREAQIKARLDGEGISDPAVVQQRLDRDDYLKVWTQHISLLDQELDAKTETYRGMARACDGD
ncbi:MAG TPA: hypothetical protein VFH51_05875, partial [Myxococcota bacterium]|nr:hypothetical protein [Myxococcota bacterium]